MGKISTPTIMALVLVVGGLVLLPIMLDNAAWALPVALIGIMIFASVITMMLALSNRSPMPLLTALQAIRAGESSSILDAAKQQRLRGNRSPETTLLLAAGHVHAGEGAEAESYAREVIQWLDTHGTTRRRDPYARTLCDMAAVTLYDALLIQGQYTAAAEAMLPRASSSTQPDLVHALAAWALFLDGDTNTVRSMLPDLIHSDVGHKHGLIVDYMRQQVWGETRSAALRANRDGLAAWQKEAARNAANPYGARLRAVLDDVRRVAGS
jgi:hypothetical protein